MELFKYNSPSTFSGGQAINNYDTVSWSESYRDPGDFDITARLSSGLREFLPEGTLISHINTLEIMMVENHVVKEDEDDDPLLTITGRGIECILEHRIVGQNQNWASPPASLSASQYELASNYTPHQAVTLINDHVYAPSTIDDNDAIPLLVAYPAISTIGIQEARIIKRGDVLKALTEILEIEDLGVRIIRRHDFDLSYIGNTASTLYLIHQGIDRRNTVIFSTHNGDIDAADYLWTIKKWKTSALVSGKFVETMVHGSETGLNRRVMLVDGQDIDGHLADIPTGGTLTDIRNKMTVRGNAALRAQKQLSLSRIDINHTPTYQFRKDYEIGDLVSVDSSYGPISAMRVVEYVEIVDDNGESGHPTLEFVEI